MSACAPLSLGLLRLRVGRQCCTLLTVGFLRSIYKLSWVCEATVSGLTSEDASVWAPGRVRLDCTAGAGFHSIDRSQFRVRASLQGIYTY